MIGNKVKRNVSGALLAVGIGCVAARGWMAAVTPQSARAWFELASIALLTALCLSAFLTYRRRAKTEP